MKTKAMASFFFLLLFGVASTGMAGKIPSNWKDWNAYPKGADAPRYTADRVQQLLVAGEKMVLIYAGYETDKVVCGSIYLPYTMVPPFGNGSKVNLNIPKDTWMVAY